MIMSRPLIVLLQRAKASLTKPIAPVSLQQVCNQGPAAYKITKQITIRRTHDNQYTTCPKESVHHLLPGSSLVLTLFGTEQDK